MGIDEYIMMVAQEEVQIKVIKNLLIQTDFSDEAIARIVEATVDFVGEVRRECIDPKT